MTNNEFIFRGTWIDIDCSFKLCTVCNFTDSPPRLFLRGLCDSSQEDFDVDFVLDLDGEDDVKSDAARLAFRGYYGSAIRWDKSASLWRMTGIDSSLVAVHNLSSEYPLGKRLWYLADEGICDGGFSKQQHHLHPRRGPKELSRYLKLSACRR